jgi:crotonobetainyl-CoA:carnitine CoA-transferase CaiB-like acyl-CoA transferase
MTPELPAHLKGTGARGGPLDGITVLDLSAFIAGPYGCTLLGDLGAHVIKIESPAGDTVRQYPSTLQAENRAYLGLNRNKKSLVLDLKRPEAHAVLMRLVRAADVLVHNFRPSVPARLKIDYETVKATNPRLIYCSVTGFGNNGPLRDRAGYDQLLQAATGICALQGKSPDQPEIVWGSVVDYYTSSMLAFAVSSALFHRERTGEGQAVSVSLLQSAMTMQSARIVWAEGEPRDIDRDFRSMGTTGIYPTADGHLYLTTTAPHFWDAFCEGANLRELANNPRYDTVRKRAEHAAELIPTIREALSKKSAKEWEALFGDRVPCAAVRSTEDLFDDPQVAAEELLATFTHPKAGIYRGMCQPVSFSASVCPSPFAAPTFGQHSRSLLAEAGYSPDEIQHLVSLGAVKDKEDAA